MPDTLLPVPATQAAELLKVAAAADRAAARGAFAAYRAGLSEQTRRAQDADLARWGRYLAAVGAPGVGYDWAGDPSSWAGVTWGLIEAFLRWQLAGGYAVASVSRALSTVRSYCRQAARAGVITAEALALIETIEAAAPRSKKARNLDQQREVTRIGEKKAVPTKISPAEARTLKAQSVDTPQGRRDGLLMCLLLDHGLRVSEVADLQVRDLDVRRGSMTFYRRKVDKTQTHKLTKDTLKAARVYMQLDALATGGLLRNSDRTGQLGEPISIQGLRDRVTFLGKRAGLEGLSPHDCRHFWASRAAQGGTDPLALQEAGGWASLAMPRRYVEAALVANERVRLAEDDELPEDDD